MKHYKEFECKYIGSSDIAALIAVGITDTGLTATPLKFGGDGSYMAYVCDEDDVEIAEHYKKELTFKYWMVLYDDDGKTFDVELNNGKIVDVYRAGDYTALIHIHNKK